MILGTITGKTTTLGFKFSVEGNAKKFQYVQIPHEGSLVLSQIMEIEKDMQSTTAHCAIIIINTTSPPKKTTNSIVHLLELNSERLRAQVCDA